MHTILTSEIDLFHSIFLKCYEIIYGIVTLEKNRYSRCVSTQVMHSPGGKSGSRSNTENGTSAAVEFDADMDQFLVRK